MGAPVLLACDWGTTHLRAFTLDADGAVQQQQDFALGVSRLEPGEAERRFHEEVCPALSAQDLPAILCGMIGSNLGWTVAPYVDCPVDAAALARQMAHVGDGRRSIRIVPGARSEGLAGGVDVMRGEETQLFGLLAQADLAQGRRLVCHPGTHAKWMRVQDGRLERFVTAMSGELFSVLGKHSVLKSDAPATDDAAFQEGLAAAGDGGALAARLFTARARVAGQGKNPDSTPSYLSGLLIGAEIASVPRLLGADAGEPVILLGDAALCALYETAFRARGVESRTFDGKQAAVTGMFGLHQSGDA